jgi:hypothetical protein
LIEIIISVGVCAFFWFLFLDWGDSGQQGLFLIIEGE